MTAPRRRGAKALLAANVVAQLCALMRYTVLARLLGPEQLGLAVTLILTSQFFESISDTGSDRFLIQDAQGDAPRVQQLVHLLAVGRGLFTATALVALAVPIAGFYHEPVLAHGLMVLAAAPLIMGFMHFDLRRKQREHDFAREGTALLVAEVVSLAVTLVAAMIARDFTASLYGLIARAVMMVAVSQRTAERPYRIGFAREHATRLARFSAPLMVNGPLLFAAGQGDRLLIGNRLGVAELGHYSSVLLLIYYPSMMLLRFFQAMHLPMIAGAKGGRETLAAAVDMIASEALLLSLAMAAGFAVVAPVAVPLLFGARFGQPATIIALIGVLQVCRFIRTWPSTAAMAVGSSGVVLANNLMRLLAFPAALAGLALVGGLTGLALGFVAGEVVALTGAVMLANRALGTRMTRDLDRIALFLLCGAAIVLAAHAVEIGRAVIAVPAVAATTMLLGLVVRREWIAVRRLLAGPLAWWPALRRRLARRA